MRAISVFSLEAGTSTLGWRARMALRTRVSMSAIGSLVIPALQLFLWLSPARLRDAGDFPVQCQLAEAQPADAELAQKRARPSAAPAAVAVLAVLLRLLAGLDVLQHFGALDLAPQMKNRRDRHSAFLNIDLPDFIAAHGSISVGEGGHQVLIEEYKSRVDARVLEIVEKHPALAALREGREVTDDQLVDLERTLHRELGRDDIQLSSRNIRIAYGLRVDNFLAFLRHLLALDAIPDYHQVVQRGFERHIQAHNYNAEQIRFLRSVQEVFLAKRTLVEADLYDPPLTNFGRNAVERFFTPQEIGDLLHLTESLAA